MARRYSTPKVIYAIDFTCGHWDATWRFQATKESCPHCSPDRTNAPGEPARVLRYYPKEKP